MEQDIAMAQAAAWIAAADGLLVTAGAGMGVDSGLPDFRGAEGFWRAYPALRRHGFSFEEMANPAGFASNPRLSWGFYGHRLALYRATLPHAGFDLLRVWSNRMQHGGFVFTSNVDGQFQKAGFDAARIMECHGSIHHLQCTEPCSEAIWPADDFAPQVDAKQCLLRNDMPRCPHCGALARPNILMFGDWQWIEQRTNQQQARLANWLADVERPVVVELGAGLSVATVRRFSERHGPRVIRINLRDAVIAPGVGIGLAGAALKTLQLIDHHLDKNFHAPGHQRNPGTV